MKNKIREMLEEIVPIGVNATTGLGIGDYFSKYRESLINALADGAFIDSYDCKEWLCLKPQPIDQAPTKSEIVEQLREVVYAFENSNCINWDEPRRLADRIERYGIADE